MRAYVRFHAGEARLVQGFAEANDYTFGWQQVPSRFVLEFGVTRSPAFRNYLVRQRGQLADRRALLQASANRQLSAC